MANRLENSAKVKLDAYKAKWKEEKDKEQWKKGIIERYEELKKKEENKTITKDEHKEYKRYEKIKSNIPKVENLWGYLEDLKEFRNQLDEEMQFRNEIKRQEERLATLDREMENIKFRIKETQEEIKYAEGKTRTVLMEDLDKYKLSLSKNQDEYSKTFIANREQKEIKTELSDMPTEQIQDLIRKTDIQNSKTNMYIEKLKQGMDINDITPMVDKADFSHLKADKANSEKMRELKDAQRNNGEKVTPKSIKDHIAQTVQGYMKDEEKRKEYEENETALANVSEFDKKHPRLARIKNWFKEKFHSIKNRMDSAIYEEEQEDGELEAEEKGLEEETPRAKFIEKLTVADYDIAKVAETGSKEYQKEDRKPKVDKKEFAKKLMENRKALYGESLKESSIDSKLDEIANEDER